MPKKRKNQGKKSKKPKRDERRNSRNESATSGIAKKSASSDDTCGRRARKQAPQTSKAQSTSSENSPPATRTSSNASTPTSQTGFDELTLSDQAASEESDRHIPSSENVTTELATSVGAPLELLPPPARIAGSTTPADVADESAQMTFEQPDMRALLEDGMREEGELPVSSPRHDTEDSADEEVSLLMKSRTPSPDVPPGWTSISPAREGSEEDSADKEVDLSVKGFHGKRSCTLY